MFDFEKMPYFNMWYDDKENIIATMYSNMQDDLRVGYDPNGQSITQQKADIEAYKAAYYAQLDKLATMDEKTINRWCYLDMKRRGVI